MARVVCFSINCFILQGENDDRWRERWEYQIGTSYYSVDGRVQLIRDLGTCHVSPRESVARRRTNIASELFARSHCNGVRKSIIRSDDYVWISSRKFVLEIRYESPLSAAAAACPSPRYSRNNLFNRYCRKQS